MTTFPLCRCSGDLWAHIGKCIRNGLEWYCFENITSNPILLADIDLGE